MMSDTLGRLRMLAKGPAADPVGDGVALVSISHPVGATPPPDDLSPASIEVVEAPPSLVGLIKAKKARRSGTVSAKVGKKKKRAAVKGFDGDAALRRALGLVVLSPVGHCRFCDRRRMVIEGRLNGWGKPK
jgi:hypothetical protein